MEVVASLSQGRTAAAQCGLFTHKSVPVIFEPPCSGNEPISESSDIIILHCNPICSNFSLSLLLLFHCPLFYILLRSRDTMKPAVFRFLYLIKLHPRPRGEFRPRQTRQLPRAVYLKGRLLSCQSH